MLFRRGGGTPDHVINTDATEGDGNRSFGFGQRGPDDFIYQRRARLQRIDLVHCACSTGSRWRGGSRWRAASALADTGRVAAFIATSITAAIARMPFLATRAIWRTTHGTSGQ